MKRPKSKTVDDATAALDTVRNEWMRRPGVTAADVGFKIKDGHLTEDVAVRVHVERKRPVGQLETEDVFNDSKKADQKVGGFPVDVIEATYGPATAPLVLDHTSQAAVQAVDRKAAVDPLVGGVSCGNPRITAGTLGSIVFDTETCEPMILSNWHVLAGASAASVGESILQPGKVDGGTSGDAVATLTRMELDSRMDAAVATLNGSRRHTRDIIGLGAVTGTDDATLGMDVIKSGRTTGITKGVVDGVSMSTRINYGDPGVVSFANQIRIVPHPPWPAVDQEVSRGGDSGSVWLSESTKKAIGLHFAGETDPAPTAENAICSPIDPIATELRFSFFPVVCRPKKVPPQVDIWRQILCAIYPPLCGPIIGPGPFESASPARMSSAPDDEVMRMLVQLLLSQRSGSGCHCGGTKSEGGIDEALMRLVR